MGERRIESEKRIKSSFSPKHFIIMDNITTDKRPQRLCHETTYSANMHRSTTSLCVDQSSKVEKHHGESI